MPGRFRMQFEGLVDGSDQVVSGSVVADDGVVGQFFDCYRAAYGRIQDGVDAGGKPILRDMTDKETFERFAAGLASGVLANVRRYVETQAVEAAKAALPAVEYTPE